MGINSPTVPVGTAQPLSHACDTAHVLGQLWSSFLTAVLGAPGFISIFLYFYSTYTVGWHISMHGQAVLSSCCNALRAPHPPAVFVQPARLAQSLQDTIYFMEMFCKMFL